MQIDDTVTILDNIVKVNNIFCFDSLNSHTGAAVYLITDNGVFVKYYEQSTSEAVCYSEEDFRLFMSEYYHFLTSCEHNYNENGEPLGGETPSLTAYLREHPVPNDVQNDKTVLFVWLGIGLSVLTAVSAAALILRGRRKRKPAEITADGSADEAIRIAESVGKIDK